MNIPASHRDILEGKNFAHIATLMPDGTPQVTPVWIDVEGDLVLFNTSVGRQKDRNLKRNPAVALSCHDQENPYRYIQIRGTVVSSSTEGADTHIDRMAKKYTGADTYQNRRPNEQRIIYRIKAEHIQVMG